MRADSFSLSERKELALKLKKELEREGFKTNWSDETGIQVEDLAIPKIVPFDKARLIIRVEEYGIYFAIEFKFIKVLEDLTEAEEINNVYEQHTEWVNELSIYLGEIDPSAKLKWDVEYDEDIEDTLYGNFDTIEEVIPFIHNMRKLIDKYNKRYVQKYS